MEFLTIIWHVISALWRPLPIPDPIPVPEPTPIPQPAPTPVPIPPTSAEKLYNTAFALRGTDVTPDDRVADEYDCADSINTIYSKCFGHKIAIPGDSTIQLDAVMASDSAHFKPVFVPEPGVIIVGVSEYRGGILAHGHIGICGKTWIMSNDSSTGKFEANYTLNTFLTRYRMVLGLKVRMYKPVNS